MLVVFLQVETRATLNACMAKCNQSNSTQLCRQGCSLEAHMSMKHQRGLGGDTAMPAATCIYLVGGQGMTT